MLGLRRSGQPLKTAFTAVLTVLVLAAGLEAVWHHHVPHAEVRTGTAARAQDEGLAGSCAICRLAHQTSPVPSAPLTAGLPEERGTPAVVVPPAHTARGVGRSFSPRAPPSSATC
jgi:hypothetical protein